MTDDLQERVARAIENEIDKQFRAGMPTAIDPGQHLDVEEIAQAAIAECNRWLPIEGVPKRHGKKLWLLIDGVALLCFWNSSHHYNQSTKEWYPGWARSIHDREIYSPTHYCKLLVPTPPDAARSDNDAE